jgi:hypothetical protein
MGLHACRLSPARLSDGLCSSMPTHAPSRATRSRSPARRDAVVVVANVPEPGALRHTRRRGAVQVSSGADAVDFAIIGRLVSGTVVTGHRTRGHGSRPRACHQPARPHLYLATIDASCGAPRQANCAGGGAMGARRSPRRTGALPRPPQWLLRQPASLRGDVTPGAGPALSAAGLRSAVASSSQWAKTFVLRQGTRATTRSRWRHVCAVRRDAHCAGAVGRRLVADSRKRSIAAWGGAPSSRSTARLCAQR